MPENLVVHKKIWDLLTGDRELFSMENRAFNFVGIISLLVLICCACIDVYLHQYFIAGILVFLLGLQVVLYYFSRFKGKYRLGTVIYAVCCYSVITINYYYNSGIKGPSLFTFFLTFYLLITISARRLAIFWISLHIVLASILVATEYFHPEWVPFTYLDRSGYFIDVVTTYIATIVFAFLLTNYLRSYYEREKKLAESRAQAIAMQAEQIRLQNEQLEKLNLEKTKLFSVISHDMRAPLDSVNGYLELLTHNLVEEDERVEIEAELLIQTRYTSDMLMNLLYWSKTQLSGVVPVLRPLSLRVMVDEARNYRVSMAARKGIKLTYSIDSDIEVIADMEMLRIVLRNLVNNAIKFTPENGEVKITAGVKDSKATISIYDTGIGIPAEKQKDIFGAGATSTTYGTNDEKGMGIGLMLCKEFVEYMGGAIWFESEVGNGTAFHVSLPVIQMQMKEAAHKEQALGKGTASFTGITG